MYITSVCNRWTVRSKLVAMIFYLWLSFSLSEAQTLKIDVFPLINDACLHCHDSYTQTELNFENLSEDLTQSETFRQWEKIFDRVTVGEMPPNLNHVLGCTVGKSAWFIRKISARYQFGNAE